MSQLLTPIAQPTLCSKYQGRSQRNGNASQEVAHMESPNFVE